MLPGCEVALAGVLFGEALLEAGGTWSACAWSVLHAGRGDPEFAGLSVSTSR